MREPAARAQLRRQPHSAPPACLVVRGPSPISARACCEGGAAYAQRLSRLLATACTVHTLPIARGSQAALLATERGEPQHAGHISWGRAAVTMQGCALGGRARAALSHRLCGRAPGMRRIAVSMPASFSHRQMLGGIANTAVKPHAYEGVACQFRGAVSCSTAQAMRCCDANQGPGIMQFGPVTQASNKRARRTMAAVAGTRCWAQGAP